MDNHKQNLLLTGASGFLGEILKPALQTKGYTVIGMGRKNQNFNEDITQPFRFPSDASFDIIIHAAGKAHSVPRTREEEKAFFDVNYQGTINLCNAIDQLSEKPKAFIFISTVAVYGVDTGEMISEQHPLDGTTPYAKSKIQAEQFLSSWAKENNITLSILRLPLIVGPNPPGNLGAMIRGVKTGKYLSIGNADARKSMIFAEDIATIVSQLIKKGGTYNLTDGYHPSFGELEQEIAKVLGRRAPIKVSLTIAKILAGIGDFLGSRAPVNTHKLTKIISSLTFDDSIAKNQLGWSPQPVLDAISRIVK